MATHTPATYFNILIPNSDEAVFNSSIKGQQFEKIAERTCIMYQLHKDRLSKFD